MGCVGPRLWVPESGISVWRVPPQVPQAVVAHVAESTEEKQNLVSSSSWISFIVLYDALVPNQCRLKLSSDHRRPFFTKSADGGKGGAGGNFYQCFVLNILNGFKHASAGLFPTQIAVFRAPPPGGARIFHQMRPAGERVTSFSSVESCRIFCLCDFSELPSWKTFFFFSVPGGDF